MKEMGGTTPWRADKSGQSCYIWPKAPKNTKKTKEKYVEEEGEIRKGERVRGEKRRARNNWCQYLAYILFILFYK